MAPGKRNSRKRKKEAKRAQRRKDKLNHDRTNQILRDRLSVLYLGEWAEFNVDVTGNFTRVSFQPVTSPKSAVYLKFDLPRLEPHKQVIQSWNERLDAFHNGLDQAKAGANAEKEVKIYINTVVATESLELLKRCWAYEEFFGTISGLDAESFVAHQAPVQCLVQCGFLTQIMLAHVEDRHPTEIQASMDITRADKEVSQDFKDWFSKRDHQLVPTEMNTSRPWFLVGRAFGATCIVLLKQYLYATHLSIGDTLNIEALTLSAPPTSLAPPRTTHAAKYAHYIVGSGNIARRHCSLRFKGRVLPKGNRPERSDQRSAVPSTANGSVIEASTSIVHAEECIDNPEDDSTDASNDQNNDMEAAEDFRRERVDLVGLENGVVSPAAAVEPRVLSHNWAFADEPQRPPKLPKIKTRGHSDENLLAEFADLNLDLEDEEVDLDKANLEEAHLLKQRPKWLFKDRRHYETWSIFFPRVGERDRAGDLTWTDFCNAIGGEPMFFVQLRRDQGGVARTFVRAARDGLPRMSFTVHKPHTKDHIEQNIVRNWRTQLKQRFGWQAEDFELQQTAPLVSQDLHNI